MNRTDVSERVAPVVHPLDGFPKENVRVASFPLRIRIREQLANVRQAEGPQDRVRDRVQQHIAVAVRYAAAVVRDVDTADDELVPGLEAVEVPAVADPVGKHWGLGGGGRRANGHRLASEARGANPLTHRGGTEHYAAKREREDVAKERKDLEMFWPEGG